MAVTALEIRTFGGAAFSAVAEADVQKWLDYVSRKLDASVWSTDLDDATTFLTLHYVQQFVLSGGAGGAAGPVASVKVGNVAVAYAGASGGADPNYSTTAWGNAYLTLRNAMQQTPLIVI